VRAIGCDTSDEALACARSNLLAAGHTTPELHGWDARALPLPDASVSALAADLPFGHLVGSHAQNVELYPAILREAARVAVPGAPFALITHEVRLAEDSLAQLPAWQVDQVLRVTLGGLHPRIFLLRREGD
jgi:tRNA G10  N-methylase Trm11